MHGDMPLASDIRRHVRAIDILGHDGRCPVGVAIDGDSQSGGISITIDVGQGVAELFGQRLAVLERVDHGIVIVQRISVAAVRADGQGAEFTYDHQVTINIGGGGAGRVVVADNGGDRGAVGAFGIGHIASHAASDDIAADGRLIFVDGIGIVTGHRGVVDDADHQILAVAIGIPVIDGDADAFVGRVAIATGVIRRAGQAVFIVDGNAAIGIRGVAVEDQLTVFSGDGLVVVDQVFNLGLAQGQGVTRHLDGDGGGVIQAVQRAQSEAGYNSGVIRIGRRATSQTAFEHHMIIHVTPRRVIRVGRIVDCRIVGVSRIVRVRYGDRDAVIAAVDSDGQGRSGLVAIGIDDGVGEGVGQRRVVRVQPLYRQVAVVQLVAVAAIGIQHQGAVVTDDIAGHTAIGHVAARTLIASGDAGYRGTVGTQSVFFTGSIAGDHIAVDRHSIFGNLVGVVTSHGGIVDDLDIDALAVILIAITVGDLDANGITHINGIHLRRTLQGVFVLDGDGAVGGPIVTIEYQFAVLGDQRHRVTVQLFDLLLAQAQGLGIAIGIGEGQLDRAAGGQAIQGNQGEAGFDREVIRIRRRTIGQAAFEYHMVVDVTIRGGGAVVHRYIDGDTIIGAVDGDGQGRGGLVAILVGDGVGEGLGQRVAIGQPLNNQIAVVQLVAVAAVGIQRQAAVLARYTDADTTGHMATGVRTGDDTSHFGTVGTFGISHIAGRATGDDIAADRNSILGDLVGIVAG